MKILVLNSGSSSIKYRLFDMQSGEILASGLIERIGEQQSRLAHRVNSEAETLERLQQIPDHREGMRIMARMLNESGAVTDLNELYGIGHRVVHGGESFTEPTLINDTVMTAIREQVPMAPLHNPANIVGIEAAQVSFPGVPQVAVFDTAFHQSIPQHAHRYAVPEDIYKRHHVRRYGFHGTSHRYVTKQAAAHLGVPMSSVNLIVLHLGSGASVTAIKQGKSVDTSMGMTPLEGLIMGTRCGDLDPAILLHLNKSAGMTSDQLESMLNRESGLKGICGQNDMREILRMSAAGDERAQLALDMYAYRIRKYIGAYHAVLGRVDAVVFTAGIGENEPEIRSRCCEGLGHLGIAIDEPKNRSRQQPHVEIQTDASAIRVLVIPTDEELEIAEETVETIEAAADVV